MSILQGSLFYESLLNFDLRQTLHFCAWRFSWSEKVKMNQLAVVFGGRDVTQVYSSRRFQPVSASAQLGRMDRIFGRKSPFFVTHPFFFLPKKSREGAETLGIRRKI